MAKKILSRKNLDPSKPVFTGIKHAEENITFTFMLLSAIQLSFT